MYFKQSQMSECRDERGVMCKLQEPFCWKHNRLVSPVYLFTHSYLYIVLRVPHSRFLRVALRPPRSNIMNRVARKSHGIEGGGGGGGGEGLLNRGALFSGPDPTLRRTHFELNEHLCQLGRIRVREERPAQTDGRGTGGQNRWPKPASWDSSLRGPARERVRPVAGRKNTALRFTLLNS